MKATTLELALDAPVDQAVFASMVGISEARVSQLVAEGVLPRNVSAKRWLLAYCERLREQAAGRGQELTIERAHLARQQRIGQEIKNAVALGEYAPIGLLADTLATACSAVADRFDALSATLAVRCPQLDEAARAEVQGVIAAARNQWLRSTEKLAAEALDELTELDDDNAVAELPPDDEGGPES